MQIPDTSAYFTPMHYILYLGTIFVLAIVYLLWSWSKIARTKVRVLVVKPDGGSSKEFAPREGGIVTLTHPKTGVVRMWPINEMCAISIAYPEGGFVPGFLQKQMQMVIVDEMDWEPILNRGPHLKRVASPDVAATLEEIAESVQDDAAREDLKILISSLSTAPTREMIASPMVLGNIIKEQITAKLLTLNQDVKTVMDGLANATKRLNTILPAMHFYIGIGLVLVAIGVIGALAIPNMLQVGEMKEQINALQNALGIVPEVPK